APGRRRGRRAHRRDGRERGRSRASRLVGLNELLNSRMLPVHEAPGLWLAGPVLLRGGTVIDTDGERVADVLVGAGGRVAAVGPDLGGDAQRGCRQTLACAR